LADWGAIPAGHMLWLMALVAGVDSSTQSTKVVIVDSETGVLAGSGTARHSVTGSGGARESEPACWEDALVGALGEALALSKQKASRERRSAKVAAISIGAQQHGLVVLDSNGRPVRPAVLWNDTRSHKEAAEVVARLGGPAECAKKVGSVLTPSFTVTKWVWLRKHEPAAAAAARGVCLPHDYLTSLLTGRLPGNSSLVGALRSATSAAAGSRRGARSTTGLGGWLVTDRSDASGTGWWEPNGESYGEDILALPEVGLDAGMLPRVLGPGEAAGEVPAALAERLGLDPATVVGPGAGDNAAAGLALGLQPGEAALSLGTSGTVFAVTGRPCADPEGVVAGFASADGKYLPLVCTLNAALAIDRVASWLRLRRDDVAPSGEVVFLPWLDGERTPNLPRASGALAGLRHATDLRSVLQAAYEGAAASLLVGLERVDAWAPLSPEAPLLLVGGGARSPVWREAVKRLSGRGIVVPKARELVALGAAVQAAAIVEECTPAEVAERWHTRRGDEEGALDKDEETLGRIHAWASLVGCWSSGA